MTSIKEQLKNLKAQETALKAQLKKSQEELKSKSKNIADFKKYVAYYESRPDFSRILRYLSEIDIGNDSGELDCFESFFLAYGQTKDKKLKKIHQICDLIEGAFPNKYPHLRKGLLDDLEEEKDDLEM